MEVVDVGATGEVARSAGYGIVVHSGTTVPGDGELGYSHGCLFVHTDGTSSLDGVYVNAGTMESSAFTAAIAVNSGGAIDLNGASDGIILDEDGDTHISAATDNVIAFQCGLNNTVAMLSSVGLTVPRIDEQLPGQGLILGSVLYKVQAAPVAETGAATITYADIKGGLVTVTQSTGATVALTLDTGAAMDTAAAGRLDVDMCMDWTLINLSAAAADTATITAANGHTVIGTMVCQSAHSTTGGVHGNAIRLRSRRTSADTWVTYRLG